MVAKYVDYFVTEENKAPFLEWSDNLEIKCQIIVDRFIQRVANGGAKKSVKSLKNNIFEIKIPYASGLRVYFFEEGDKIVLLLGGDKKTQAKDIKKAKEYRSYYGQQK